MKKLVMLLVAAVMTGMVSAAQMDWKLTVGASYGGNAVYALTGTTAAMVLAACQSNDASVWSSTFDGFSGYTTQTGSNARIAISGKALEIEAGDNLVFVIVKGGIADGSTYTVLNDYNISGDNVYNPPATGTEATPKLTDLGIAGSGTFAVGHEPIPEPIPEPTSGLLLLFGGAMLALRRRQK